MILLFDLGGVVVDLDKQRCLDGFLQLGLDASPYIGAFGQQGVFEALEEGKIDHRAFCEGVRALGCRPETTDEEILTAWSSFLVGVPTDRLELLWKIKRHYRTAVLSNTNVVMWEKLLTYFQHEGRTIADCFDDTFLSFEMGVCKPAPAIFERVVEGLGVPAHEILFLDDSEENCEAARRCGMQALHAPAGGAWKNLFDETGKLR